MDLTDLTKYRALPKLADILARAQGLGDQTQGLDALTNVPHIQPLPFFGTPGTPGSGTPMPYGGGSYGPGSGTNMPYTGPTNFTGLGPGKYPVVDRTPQGVPNPSQVTPEIQRVYDEVMARWPNATNMGTYNVRNVAGTSTPSYHSYGDAIDIGGTPNEMAQIATMAANRAKALGVTQVIYNGSIWTTDQGWHGYSGVDPHTGHVHITGPLSYNDTTPDYPTVTYDAPRRRSSSSKRPRGVPASSTRRQQI